MEKIPQVADRAFTIGKYRGMSFGIEYRWNSPHVFLSGQAVLDEQIGKDAGPRAVLNALGRIQESYDGKIERNEQDLSLFRTQLADYEARQGRSFAHEGYFKELTDLRDQLKIALSDTPPEGVSAGDIADKITALRAGNKVEAAPSRLREKPRVEVVRRRTEQPAESEPKPPTEVKPEEPPEDKPDDKPTFRQMVRPRRSFQPRLF